MVAQLDFETSAGGTSVVCGDITMVIGRGRGSACRRAGSRGCAGSDTQRWAAPGRQPGNPVVVALHEIQVYQSASPRTKNKNFDEDGGVESGTRCGGRKARSRPISWGI